jgi:hypothetical protein
MSRIKIIVGAGLAILALSALGASAPVASAKNPCKAPAECYGVLTEGVHIPVKENDPIDIVSEGVVTFTGGTLVVNCPQGELNGSIIIVKGNLQASITGASFGGAGGCSSSSGPMSVTGGPAPGTALTQTLKTNGKSQLSGPFMLKLSLDEGAMSCFYSAKSIKGSYNTDEEQPIVIGTKPPKFKVQEGSGPGCPKTGTLSSGGWDVTAGSPASGQGPLVFLG